MYHDNPSVKDSERMRRQNAYPIILSMINESTPISKDMATFWPSSANKLLLEKLVYTCLCEKLSVHPIVIGQLVPGEESWQCCISNETVIAPYISQPYIEEADLQIIVHILDSIKSGCYINVVLSNDVDVAVGLLFNMLVFVQHGPIEVWRFRGGKGDTTRFVPLHTF